MLRNAILHLPTDYRDYDLQHPDTYPETDVFLVCFSIATPASFESIERRVRNYVHCLIEYFHSLYL